MIRYITFMLAGFIISHVSAQENGSILETRLDHIFKNELSDNEPGGSILIQKSGEIVFLEGYGLANMETKEHITETSIFNTGSISKTFVANGILILNERGLLSLDDDLAMYFDDFESKQIARKVRIRHLLSHTSGLPDIRRVSDNPSFYLTAKDEANFAPIKKTTKLNFQPGEQFEYSNPSYNGLALIIEKVSDQPWQDFIRDNIFTPSGMTSSKITNGPHPESGVAHAYVLDDGKYVEYDYGEYPTFAAAGNGGVWSSVIELAKYEKALREEIFLSPKMIEQSRTPFQPENWKGSSGAFIGYSWFVGEQNLLGDQSDLNVSIVYHTGSQGGFRAFYVTIPDKEILMVGLFNRPLTDFKSLIQRPLELLKENNWLD